MLTKLRARFKRPIRFTTTLGEVRQSRGLTQEDLAEYCEVSVETIRMIEAAKYEPSVVLAARISEKLNARIDEIFSALPRAAKNSTERPDSRDQQFKAGMWINTAFLFIVIAEMAALLTFIPISFVLLAFCVVGLLDILLIIAFVQLVPGYNTHLSIGQERLNPQWDRIKLSMLKGFSNALLFTFIVQREAGVERLLIAVLLGICFSSYHYFFYHSNISMAWRPGNRVE